MLFTVTDNSIVFVNLCIFLLHYVNFCIECHPQLVSDVDNIDNLYMCLDRNGKNIQYILPFLYFQNILAFCDKSLDNSLVFDHKMHCFRSTITRVRR